MIGWIQRGDERHPGKAVRPILVVLPPLVEDDVALVFELGVREGRQQVAHAIGLHPQRELDGVGGHDFPVVRAVGVGRSVQDAADFLERPEIARIVVLRPFEHQVFEEVRKTGAPWLLVLRADVVPDVDGDDRAAVILVHDHIEPVRQLMVHEWNVHGGKTGTRRLERWRVSARPRRQGFLNSPHPDIAVP